jgi:hypothetical protein
MSVTTTMCCYQPAVRHYNNAAVLWIDLWLFTVKPTFQQVHMGGDLVAMSACCVQHDIIRDLSRSPAQLNTGGSLVCRVAFVLG